MQCSSTTMTLIDIKKLGAVLINNIVMCSVCHYTFVYFDVKKTTFCCQMMIPVNEH